MITISLFYSCKSDISVPVNPDFQISFLRDGQPNALAGNNYYVINKGSGEFVTLFDGKPGSVWGEPNASGINFDSADSLRINYDIVGKYKVTVVSTSTGDFGKDSIRRAKTIEIEVVDQRNQFSDFSLKINGNKVAGKISDDNKIQFAIPDNTIDFNYVASFTVNSALAKVAINGVPQVSGVTSNNFKNSVQYTVTSAQGNVTNYTVVFTTFPPSTEKKLTKFQLTPFTTGSNGEIAIIDETNKIINLALNYASSPKGPKLIIESSPFSSVLINGFPYSDSKNYTLNTITSVIVVAQDGSSTTYTMNLTLQTPVLTFSFSGLIPSPVGVIDNDAKTITVNVLRGTDVTKLVALWTGSLDQVQIGTVVQSNGKTINDFTNPLTYTFYKGTLAGDSYIVTVNVK